MRRLFLATPWPARWGFEKTSGSVIDSSGNNNNGTLFNGATWTAQGHSRQGITLNGTNQYALVPNTTSLTFTQSFTFSAWGKPASVQMVWKSVVSKNGIGGLYASTAGTTCGAGAPAMWFYVNGSQSQALTVCTKTLLPIGQWSHLAGTYDNAAGQLKL